MVHVWVHPTQSVLVCSFLAQPDKRSGNSPTAFFTGGTPNRLQGSVQVSVGEGHCRQRQQQRTKPKEARVLSTLHCRWRISKTCDLVTKKEKAMVFKYVDLCGAEQGKSCATLEVNEMTWRALQGGRFGPSWRKATTGRVYPTGKLLRASTGRTRSWKSSVEAGWLAVRDMGGSVKSRLRVLLTLIFDDFRRWNGPE